MRPTRHISVLNSTLTRTNRITLQVGPSDAGLQIVELTAVEGLTGTRVLIPTIYSLIKLMSILSTRLRFESLIKTTLRSLGNTVSQ